MTDALAAHPAAHRTSNDHPDNARRHAHPHNTAHAQERTTQRGNACEAPRCAIIGAELITNTERNDHRYQHIS